MRAVLGIDAAWTVSRPSGVEAIQSGKELNKTTAEEIMTKEVVTADVNTSRL
jgi:hypothetical protein